MFPNLKPPKLRANQPTWEIAALYPTQGNWSEAEYLRLEGNQLIEYDNGFVEFLEMPSPMHQLLLAFLYRLLFQWTTERQAGELFFAPLPLQVEPRRYREPDLMFVAAAHANWIEAQRLVGADLVVEVVSGDRERDFVDKRADYARLGVAEYWIVDPRDEQVHVLTLAGDAYAVHGVFGRGQAATSVLLPGFTADVDAVFDAGQLPEAPAA